MPVPKVTLACRHYDGTSALVRGLIQPPGYQLQVIEMKNVASMFAGMFQGRYDVSEMSLAELVYYVSRGQNDFTGIPVFPSRYFRHGFILYNADSDIEGPEDLSGKRIGFLRWVQTAAIWIRGTLIDEYGVSPRETKWYVASLHHWHEAEKDAPIQPRDGSIIRRLEGSVDPHETIIQALKEGRIDALGTTENELFSRLADAGVRKLFPHSREVESRYFRKTKIYPIMHAIVIRNAVVKQYPDLPRQLFELFSQAKNMGRDWLRSVPSLGVAWKNDYIEEESQTFGCDPWAYGIKPNEHVLSRFLKYCHDEGISAKEVSPRDLFFPSTWELVEASTSAG